jgi:hypothetical protein
VKNLHLGDTAKNPKEYTERDEKMEKADLLRDELKLSG